MSFSMGGVVIVKKDGKYGMINKKGQNLTPFKYDDIISWSTDGKFTAKIGSREIYLDRRGNEYSSETERNNLSQKKLVSQGDPKVLYELGKKYYTGTAETPKSYSRAIDYLSRSVENYLNSIPINLKGYYPLFYRESLYYLGLAYYYGDNQVLIDFLRAFKYFTSASNLGRKDAIYYLAWMFEHGQGTSKNLQKAIELYQEIPTIRDSKDRIRLLKMK